MKKAFNRKDRKENPQSPQRELGVRAMKAYLALSDLCAPFASFAVKSFSPPGIRFRRR